MEHVFNSSPLPDNTSSMPAESHHVRERILLRPFLPSVGFPTRKEIFLNPAPPGQKHSASAAILTSVTRVCTLSAIRGPCVSLNPCMENVGWPIGLILLFLNGIDTCTQKHLFGGRTPSPLGIPSPHRLTSEAVGHQGSKALTSLRPLPPRDSLSSRFSLELGSVGK